MKFTTKELSILAVAELQANLSNKAIAKIVGCKEHTVRYYLSKLERLGVISRRPLIDMHRLGLVHFTILFSVRFDSAKSETQIIKFLKQASFVTWIFQLSGHYQYGVSISSTSVAQAREYIDSVARNFGDAIHESAITIQHSITYFGRRYLSPKLATKSEPLFFSVDNQPATLSLEDEQYLELIAEGSLPSYSEQSKYLGVPISTLHAKRVALEKLGVIRGSFYWIDGRFLDRKLYIIIIFSRGMNSSLRDDLQKFATKNLSVVYLIEGIGNWSFEIGVEVASEEELSRLSDEIYQKFRMQIERIQTVPILRYIKWKAFRSRVGRNKF